VAQTRGGRARRALGDGASRARRFARDSHRDRHAQPARCRRNRRRAKTRAEVAGESSRPRLDLEGFLETQGVSEQNLKAARDRIGSEATLALATVDAGRRRLALAERTQKVAEESYEAERARFELGEVIPIAVQEAEDVLRRARLRVARARVDLAQAHTDLLHLSGKLGPRYRASAAR
jgi:outer membrane protein TolC